jgi:hypothetical protein
MNSISEMKTASEAAAAPAESVAEFNNIVFPSRPKEAFRITCGPLNDRDRWNFWLETRELGPNVNYQI